jgi:hypothetical protein
MGWWAYRPASLPFYGFRIRACGAVKLPAAAGMNVCMRRTIRLRAVVDAGASAICRWLVVSARRRRMWRPFPPTTGDSHGRHEAQQKNPSQPCSEHRVSSRQPVCGAGILGFGSAQDAALERTLHLIRRRSTMVRRRAAMIRRRSLMVRWRRRWWWVIMAPVMAACERNECNRTDD